MNSYPPGFKTNRDKRFAAVSQVDSGENSKQDSAHVTMQQYNQLIEFLNKLNLLNPTSVKDDISGHALLAGTFCLLSHFSNNWLLDSGATYHISNSISDFEQFQLVSDLNSHITIPDGRKIKVTHTGIVRLNDKITLHNVLLVPEFKYRLISVHKLCKDMNSNICFSDTKCYLQDLSLKQPPLHLGELQNGLYSITSSNVNGSQFFDKAANTSISEDTKLWHLRLGHLPFQKIKIVQPNCSVTDCVNDSIYQICPQAKQSMQSFPTSSIKYSFVFQLIHLDI